MSSRHVRSTIAVYDAQARTYTRHWGRRRHRLSSLLRQVLARLPPGGLVLDLGCGPGQDLRELRRMGYAAVGLDLSPALLLYARRRSPRAGLIRADLRRCPLRPSSCAAIWSAASLIHLPKRALSPTLRRLRRLVEGGGVLAATISQGSAVGIVERGWLPGRFVARWRKLELAAAVRKAGWEILLLNTVTNGDRKGRWLHLLAKRPDEQARGIGRSRRTRRPAIDVRARNRRHPCRRPRNRSTSAG